MADTVYYDPLSLGTHYNMYSGKDCVIWLRARKAMIGGVVYTGNGGNVSSPIDGTTAMAGAVGKWGYDNGSKTEGHVAFVEYIDSNGSPVFSNPSSTAGAVWVATKADTDAYMVDLYGWPFKGYWYTNAVPNGSGPGPDPGPSPDPPATYTATGSVISPVEGCYVKVAITDVWGQPADSEYSDSVTWEEGTTNKMIIFKAFNEAGTDEDGYPKAEWVKWTSGDYIYNPRYYYSESGGTYNLPTSDVTDTANFTSYPWRYYSDSGSQGPGYVEAGFSTSSTSQDFKWRPYYHQNDTIYEVPKPSAGCIFKGWDVNGNDRSAYKTVPGSTDNDISAQAYFASLTNPYTWQFGDDIYPDKTKYITACSCTFSGKVLGGTTIGPKIGLYINGELVAQGYGTINWTGYAVTTTNTVKVRALEDSGSNYFMDVSLSSFKLTYYIYEKDNTGQGETRYLYTDYFDGSRWTYWKRAEV